MQITAGGSDTIRILEWIASGIGGALVALVAFRTKLALMDREIAGLKEDLQMLREENQQRHKENQDLWTTAMEEMNRRQNMVLEIVAGIARKVGVDARMSDTLIRYLSEENGT